MQDFIVRLRLMFTYERLTETIGDIDHIFQFAKQKIRRFGKRFLYGAGISVVSLAAIGGIMYAFNLGSFAEQANAITLAEGLSSPITFIISLVASLLYILCGALSSIVAAILDVVIEYPWGDFWVTAGSAPGGYINVTSVVTGWRIVRDICNLFFAIILLIIALAAVLNLESYKWQDLLRKFILYAVLINFSKTICGFFTDAANVAMATFGGSIGGSWGGGVLAGLGAPALGNFFSSGGFTDSAGVTGTAASLSYEATGAVIIAAFLQFSAFVILTVFVVMLIARIVLLWVLIVLSPLAYITRILDVTKRYSTQWWEMWGRYIILGPFMTFFLWLTLTMMNGAAVGTSAGGLGGAIANPLTQGLTNVQSLTKASNATTTALTQLNSQSSSQYGSTNPSILANYLIGFIMLSAALKFTSGMSGEIGEYTGKASAAAGSLVNSGVIRGSQMVSSLGSGIRGSFGASETDEEGKYVNNSLGTGALRFFGTGLDMVGNLMDVKGSATNVKNALDANAKTRANASAQGAQELAGVMTTGRRNAATRAIGAMFGATTEGGTQYVEGVTLKNILLNEVLGLKMFKALPFIGQESRENKQMEENKKAIERANDELAHQKRLVEQFDADQGISPEKLALLENAQKIIADADEAIGNIDPSEPETADQIIARLKASGSIDIQDKAIREIVEDRASDPATDPAESKKLLDLINAGAKTIATGDVSDALLGALGVGFAKPGQVDKAARLAKKAQLEEQKKNAAKAAGVDSLETFTDLLSQRAERTKAVADAEGRKKTATQTKDAYEREVLRTRGYRAIGAAALSDQRISEASKGLDGLEVPQLQESFTNALISGNGFVTSAILRKLVSLGAGGWAIPKFLQQAAESNPDFRKQTALLGADLGTKMYELDETTGAPKFTTTVDGKKEYTQISDELKNDPAALKAAIAANKVGMVYDTSSDLWRLLASWFSSNGGFSQQEAYRQMSVLANLEKGNDRGGAMGVFDFNQNGYRMNSPEMIRILQGMLSSPKNALALAGKDWNMPFSRDMDGNVTDVNKGVLDNYIRSQNDLDLKKMDPATREVFAREIAIDQIRQERDKERQKAADAITSAAGLPSVPVTPTTLFLNHKAPDGTGFTQDFLEKFAPYNKKLITRTAAATAKKTAEAVAGDDSVELGEKDEQGYV